MEAQFETNFYKTALDNVPAYCSNELYEEAILSRDLCYEQLSDLVNKVYAPGTGTIVCKPPRWLVLDCKFGELGWVGPDQEICEMLSVTPYYVAWALCAYDENCSCCLEMTDGDVSHCFKYAYYP